MKNNEKELYVECPNCNYGEYQILDKEIENHMDSEIICPNCNETTMIIKENKK